MEIFSEAWAVRCGDLLRASSAYRDASTVWEGDLVFRISGVPEGPAAYFDLWHGDCRAVRPATAHDLASAGYVIEGSAEVWQQILEGRLVPLLALMTGRMKLVRGRIPELVPHANSAKELLTVMSRIDAAFPT